MPPPPPKWEQLLARGAGLQGPGDGRPAPDDLCAARPHRTEPGAPAELLLQSGADRVDSDPASTTHTEALELVPEEPAMQLLAMQLLPGQAALWPRDRFDALAAEYAAAAALLALPDVPLKERAEGLEGRALTAHSTAGRNTE